MMRCTMWVPLFSRISRRITFITPSLVALLSSECTINSPSTWSPLMKSMMFWNAKVPVLFTEISKIVLPSSGPLGNSRLYSRSFFCCAFALLNNNYGQNSPDFCTW